MRGVSMLGVRICLLLLLEAGFTSNTSHAVTLPRANAAAKDDRLLRTRSSHQTEYEASRNGPLVPEETTGALGTFGQNSHIVLERSSPACAPRKHILLGASGFAETSLNRQRDASFGHGEAKGGLPQGQHGGMEAEANTLRGLAEDAPALGAPTGHHRGELALKYSTLATSYRTAANAVAAPPDEGEIASTAGPSTQSPAQAFLEAHHDESRFWEKAGGGPAAGGSPRAEHPPYMPPTALKTGKAPVSSRALKPAPFSLSSGTATAVWEGDKACLPGTRGAAEGSAAEPAQVADTMKVPQAANLTMVRGTKPVSEEDEERKFAARVTGGNCGTDKGDLKARRPTGAPRSAGGLAAADAGQFVELESLSQNRSLSALTADTTEQERRGAKNEGKDSQPVEKKLARQGPDLSKRETQNLVDTHALAQKVRKFVGLRAGSSLHLETQNLIEKNCDISTFGPSYCASKANPRAEALLWSLEHRKNTTCFVIALITLAFGVLVQTLIRLLEDRINQGKDEFSKEVMETAFRQIATISIVNVILWGVMQSNLASILDQLIFGDVIPKERDSDAVLENVSPMLEVLFEELFFVAVILLVWYVLYVLIFQCLTRQLIDWMRRVDEESDIPEVARQAEIQRKRCCGWLLGRRAIDKANFIAHRYEFDDNVQAMSIPGVDPTGYYFMEYLRAALLRMAIEMIRLPNSTLIFLMLVGVCLRPLLSFRLSQEVALVSILSTACLLGMLLVWAYVSRIEHQLRPRHIPQYLVLRYHMDVGGHSDSYVEEFTPPYKLQKQKDTWPGLMSLLYGTTLPNKHQQLFCFWANGPALVLRALEASFFCQLLVLAWWVQLMRNHPATWLRYCWWGNLIVGANALLQFGLLENVVYTVLVALNSGLLIEPELLERVWDMQRAENMRLIAELTDALRVQSTLYALKEGGDIFWRQLLIRSKSAPRQMQEQRLSIWAGLDEEHQGEIRRDKVFRYLSSQGLPVKSEADVSDFLQVFDRDGKGGLNEDEFFVLVMIVKQMLLEPLDKDALRALFENEYGIPWTSAVGIDMPTLSKILSKLHLLWTEGKKRYLFDFVGGRRGTTSVSPDQFVTSLQAMDEEAMQPLQADTAGRYADGERFS